MIALLVFVILVLLAGWGGTLYALLQREHDQQSRDAGVVAALVKPTRTPEWRVMLLGGPCDGGSIVVSLTVWKMLRVNLDECDTGAYVQWSRVEGSEGGGVLTYRWHATSEVAA